MSLNINLFVHGVPMGQKIWGPRGDDHRYISSFYGPQWDAPEVMKIDIMTLGSITYCYYSFVKGQNVYDSQGRDGSYIALTLKMNAFYGDIQNVYNILKAVYDKMCVGLCVTEKNGSTKFLLSDFQSIDDKLKAIERHILNYISEFSTTNDIINLNGFSVSGQGALDKINLHECTSHLAFEKIRHSGNLMVSPWYLSISAERTVSQFKAEMQKTTEKANQEIQIQQQSAQERINTITKQFQEELRTSKEQSQKQLAQIKDENEQKIAAIKNQYADVDAKLNMLNQTIKEREREISDWQSQCKRKDKEIQSSIRNVEKLEHQISKLQDNLDELQSGDGMSLLKPKKWKWVLAGIASFFIVLLIGLLTWFTIHRFNGQKKTIRELRETIEQLQTITNNNVRSNTIQAETKHSADTTHITIVVKEFTDNRKYVKVGELYHISLSDSSLETTTGKWESKEFDIIEGNTMMAKRDYAGRTGRISYKVEDKEIASLELDIKE
jgi:hypothetical protein